MGYFENDPYIKLCELEARAEKQRVHDSRQKQREKRLENIGRYFKTVKNDLRVIALGLLNAGENVGQNLLGTTHDLGLVSLNGFPDQGNLARSETLQQLPSQPSAESTAQQQSNAA